MQTTVLNYRIVIEPDQFTGTNKPCYTAYCPTLGVADGGDTIEEAIQSVQGAIEAYVDSLVDDGLPVPVDNVDQSLVASAKIEVQGNIQFV